jgi:hypothetical protein
MSAGVTRVAALDIADSAADVPTEPGVSRLRRAGGFLQKAEAGGLWLPIGFSSQAVQVMGDSNATIALADAKAIYAFLPGTLTANRTLTISAAGAPALGWQASICAIGAQAFDIIINDDAATLIHTIPAGRKAVFNSYFNSATSHAITGNWYFLP